MPMKQKTIDEILLPYKEDIPLDPSVMMGDRIVHALELMVNRNLKRIAVLHNNRPVGMLRLEDAFRMLGINMPEKH